MVQHKRKMNEKRSKMILLSAALLLAVLFVLFVFTPGNIDPNNVRWAVNGGGDNLQHYLGWRFFRNSRWTRYILFMKDLDYPIGTSVIVTDSNPLCCLLFKLLKGYLPESFQFNGIWILSSYLLLAYFAALIGWHITKNSVFTFTGVVITVLNPVILQRALIHENLTSHWLILAAVWLFLNYEKRWNPLGWMILTGLSLLIHIYFIPTIAFILCLQMIRNTLKKKALIRIFLPFLAFAGTLTAGYFMLGYLYILPQSGSYGELSMNLNSFINPDGVSSILKSRPILPLQYEGFNYLGLGLILLAAAGIITSKLQGLKMILPYLPPTLFLVLAAASHEAYFDLLPVYHIDLPDNIYSFLSVFRSSGRLVWPVYYLVLFVSLHFLSQSSKSHHFLCWFAAGCALLQMFDLKDYCIQTGERFRNPANTIAAIPQEFTDMIPEETVHLYVSDGDSKTVDAMALFAADHHMTFNRIANARGIKPVFGGDVFDMQTLTCDQIIPGSVYLYLKPEDFPERLSSCGSASISDVNGWKMICITK